MRGMPARPARAASPCSQSALARRCERIAGGRQPAGDDPRQHVAGAGHGEPRRRRRREHRAAVGCGDHRVRPLGDHHRVRCRRQRAGTGELGVALDTEAFRAAGPARPRAASAPAARRGPRPAPDRAASARRRRPRVGRSAASASASRSRAPCRRGRGQGRPAPPRCDRRRAARRAAPRAAITSGEHRRMRRAARQPHRPGPGAHRRVAGHQRGAGHRPADHQHQPARILVRIRAPARRAAGAPATGWRLLALARADRHQPPIAHPRRRRHRPVRELPRAERKRRPVVGQPLR